MNARERFLAVYSETERKKLDKVPSFVQYVRHEFIGAHEEELFGNYADELYYNLRLDAPLVLGFDAVFSDIPHSNSMTSAELEDKDGTKHSVGLNGQISKQNSSFYNKGLLYSMDNLDRLRSAIIHVDAQNAIRSTLDFYEKVGSRIFPVPAISGIFDTMWMAMTMNEFAINYRKKTKLFPARLWRKHGDGFCPDVR